MNTSTAVRPGSAVAIPGAPQLPQVNLLPPEIRAGRQLRNLRPWLGIAVLTSVLVAAVATLLSSLALRQAEDGLVEAQDENASLIAEQAQYAEVPKVLAELANTEEARLYGMSAETLWAPYMAAVAATAPAGVSVESLSMTIASSSALSTSAVPGTEPAVAQLTFDARSLTLPDTAAWLEGLEAVPGFAHPWFTAATISEENGVVHYVVAGSIDLTADALAWRFMQTDEES